MDVEPKVDSNISAESGRSRLTLHSLGRPSYSAPKFPHLQEVMSVERSNRSLELFQKMVNQSLDNGISDEEIRKLKRGSGGVVRKIQQESNEETPASEVQTIRPGRRSLQPQKQKPGKVSCNCTKIQCQKKYCACFAAGKKCSRHCRCEQCQNKANFMEQELPEVPFRNAYKELQNCQMVQEMQFEEFSYKSKV